MAINKSVGQRARSAVKKNSQLKTTLAGASVWAERNDSSGEFVAVKKTRIESISRVE
jgi:hypothetical protein